MVGVGTTTPLAIYSRWFEKFEKTRPISSLVYIPSGSEAGMEMVSSGAADFGSSDVALSDRQLAKSQDVADRDARVAIVPIYNVPGVPHPKFSRTGAGWDLSGNNHEMERSH